MLKYLCVLLVISGGVIHAEELVPKVLADEVMGRGEVVSSKFLHDGLNMSTSIHVLLIRYDLKFYNCLVSADHKQCSEFGEKTID